MGKTKIKTIDDSQPEAEEKKTKPSKIVGGAEERSQASTAANPAQPESEDAPEIPERQDPLSPKQDPKQQKTAKTKKSHGKKYQEKAQLVNPNQTYPLEEALELAQQASYSKFPGSLEIHINTLYKNIRGNVSLPHSVGKQLTILAFGSSTKDCGADLIGNEETIAQIAKGKINFDAIVSTPEWMPKLAQVAKVLGPKGLMPSPKNETVTENLAKAVLELKGGKTEYKTEPNGQVIHLLIGKVDQPKEEIKANIKVLYNTIGKSKIAKITLSPTMGPGVKVNPSSI